MNPSGSRLRHAIEVLACTAVVFRKDFIGILRSRRAFWAAVLTVAATALIPLLSWPAEGRPVAVEEVRRVFTAYKATLTISVVLIVCSGNLLAVWSERTQGTLEMLAATRLLSSSIFLGKGLSVAGFALLLIAFSFPMALGLLLLGGFEQGEFWSFLLFLFLAVLVGGTWIGTVIQEHARSWRLPVAVLRWGKDMSVFYILLFSTTDGVLNPTAFWFCTGVLLAVLLHQTIRVLIPSTEPFQIRFHPPSPHVRGNIQEVRFKGAKFYKRVFDPLPDGGNPVYHRTLRQDPFKIELSSSLIFLAGFFLACVVLAAVDSPSFGLTVITAPFFLLPILVGTGTTLSSVREETHSGAIDQLRCTPLTSREILWGKLLGFLARRSSKLFFASSLFFLLILLAYASKFGKASLSILLFYPTFAIVILLAATAGLLGAALSRSTLQAVVLSYTILLGPLLVLPLFWGPTRLLSSAISPVIGFYATVDRYFDAGKFLPGPFLMSLLVGLTLAALQFFLAVAVFEMRWLRDR